VRKQIQGDDMSEGPAQTFREWKLSVRLQEAEILIDKLERANHILTFYLSCGECHKVPVKCPGCKALAEAEEVLNP
jgi:hypothetical protein